MPTLLDEALAFRAVVSDLSGLAAEMIEDLWRDAADPNPVKVRNALLDDLPSVMRPMFQTTADATAQWYEGLDPRSRYRADPAFDVPEQGIEGNVRWALTPLFRSPDGGDVALKALKGSMAGKVFGVAGSVVERNASREGVRYYRHAQASACSFCQMLATRQMLPNGRWKAVYRSPGTTLTSSGEGPSRSTSANPQGRRPKGSLYHDDCECVAVPVRGGRSFDPPDYVRVWQDRYEQAYRNLGSARDANGIVREMYRIEHAA